MADLKAAFQPSRGPVPEEGREPGAVSTHHEIEDS